MHPGTPLANLATELPLAAQEHSLEHDAIVDRPMLSLIGGPFHYTLFGGSPLAARFSILSHHPLQDNLTSSQAQNVHPRGEISETLWPHIPPAVVRHARFGNFPKAVVGRTAITSNMRTSTGWSRPSSSHRSKLMALWYAALRFEIFIGPA